MSNICIPLGENCQLGAALEFYGYQESSLFKWAQLASYKLLAALRNNCQEIFDQEFSDVLIRPPGGKAGLIGKGKEIELPNDNKWGSFEEYKKILFHFEPDQIFNTAVIDKKRGFTHGITLTKSSLEQLDYSYIRNKNQQKIEYLKSKTLDQIHNESRKIIFIRVQRNLNQKILHNLNLIHHALQTMRLNKPFEFIVVSLDTNYSIVRSKTDKRYKVILFHTFPPPGNPMLLQHSYPQWKQLFTELEIPKQSKRTKFKGFTGFGKMSSEATEKG